MGCEGDPVRRALESMRIEAEGARLTFVARLARENGWLPDHARRVDAEYRRFLYLAATQGPVTPSDAVDRAWHLHLTYTRHYWDEMCGRILGRPLHHEPTEGGGRAARRFLGQYEATLSRYRDTFGVAPPGDIWPSPECRFSSDPSRAEGRHGLVRPRRGRLALSLGVGGLLVAASGAAAAAGTGSVGDSVDSILLAVVVVMGAAGVGSLLFRRRRRSRRRDGGCGSDDTSCGGGFDSSSDSGGGDSGGDSGCGGGCGGGD